MHLFHSVIRVLNAIAFFHRWLQSKTKILLLLVKSNYRCMCVCVYARAMVLPTKQTKVAKMNTKKKCFFALSGFCIATAFSFTYTSGMRVRAVCTPNNTASLSRSEICASQSQGKKRDGVNGTGKWNKHKKATIVSFIVGRVPKTVYLLSDPMLHIVHNAYAHTYNIRTSVHYCNRSCRSKKNGKYRKLFEHFQSETFRKSTVVDR